MYVQWYEYTHAQRHPPAYAHMSCVLRGGSRDWPVTTAWKEPRARQRAAVRDFPLCAFLIRTSSFNCSFRWTIASWCELTVLHLVLTRSPLREKVPEADNPKPYTLPLFLALLQDTWIPWKRAATDAGWFCRAEPEVIKGAHEQIPSLPGP